MATYEELIAQAIELSQRKGRGSISPSETFGLVNSLIKKIQGVDLSANSLSIRRVYKTVSSMMSDASAPTDQETGRRLKYGQLVCIADPANPASSDTGKIYSYIGTSWQYLRQLGDLSPLMSIYQTKFEDLEKHLSGHDDAIAANLKNIQYLKIRDLSELDDLLISDLSTPYKVRIYLIFYQPTSGNAYTNTETFTLLVGHMNGYVTQTYIGQRDIDDNGEFLNLGFVNRVIICSRGKVSSNPWSSWTRMVDKIEMDNMYKTASGKLFSEVVASATILSQSTISDGDVVWVSSASKFAMRVGSGVTAKYYSNWNGRDQFQSDSGVVISQKYYDHVGNIYLCNDGKMKRIATVI